MLLPIMSGRARQAFTFVIHFRLCRSLCFVTSIRINKKLIHQYNFAWDCIKQDFHQNQYCKTEETEETLEKQWENLKGAQSKY
jgi:hypothetical protein